MQNCCVSAQRWTAANLPDMSGKTVIVTGASSGLGVATARDFARAGARVILAVRNVAKGTAVAQGIAGHTEVRRLELADLASIRAFADAWTGDIDILVNNAGIMWVPAGKTVDGFELQIGTNHLGHFALTNRLLPHITERVVTVSSYLHRGGHIDVDDINWERRRYRPARAYAELQTGKPALYARVATTTCITGKPRSRGVRSSRDRTHGARRALQRTARHHGGDGLQHPGTGCGARGAADAVRRHAGHSRQHVCRAGRTRSLAWVSGGAPAVEELAGSCASGETLGPVSGADRSGSPGTGSSLRRQSDHNRAWARGWARNSAK